MKFLIPVLLLLTGCGKNSSFVHSISPVAVRMGSETQAVVADGGQVDIIWVIDNSGSMDGIHLQVQANAGLFMQEFSGQNVLDWKLGLVSTAIAEQPYLGFASPFDFRNPDPVGVFKGAVVRLGTNGDGIERSFRPVLDKIRTFPNFLRPQAHLAVIMVSDEDEQSNIPAADFVAQLTAAKGGRASLVRVYAALNSTDFGCTQGTTNTYRGSPYEAAVNATNGKAYSTCSPTFGADLADLGKDIASAISTPTLLLKERPRPSTIKVVYKGQELPPGLRINGGKWLYDEVANGVRFHDMTFVDVTMRNVDITYEVDQGQID
jgi:hypothetical protein